MFKCISLGIVNKYYTLILLYIIIALFNNSLYGINYYTAFNQIKLLDNGHFAIFGLIHNIFGC